MRIKRVTAVYFSPTGNAEKISKVIAERVGEVIHVPIRYIDFTLPINRTEEVHFASDELVVFCVPVYAGRIPNKILPFVQELFFGNRTPVISIVTFGNRNYDNALKELCFELDKKGFLAVGAAAIVAEHSFSDKLAQGRPNAEDISMLHDFADALVGKILLTAKEKQSDTKSFDRCPLDVNNIFLDIDAIPGQWPVEKYYTPLGMDGQPAKFLKAKPQTDKNACIECGICVKNCPMGSIDATNPKNVEGVCIKCQACVKKCPNGAKFFADEAFLSHVKMLEENYSRQAESSVFI